MFKHFIKDIAARKAMILFSDTLLGRAMLRKSIMNMKKVKFYATLRGEGLIAALPHTPFC